MVRITYCQIFRLRKSVLYVFSITKLNPHQEPSSKSSKPWKTQTKTSFSKDPTAATTTTNISLISIQTKKGKRQAVSSNVIQKPLSGLYLKAKRFC